MSAEQPLSVAELLTLLKDAVESQVGEQRVCGEIGSCKTASSGHIYFTLKDAAAQLSCVLYRYQAHMCRVRLREGLQVELGGRATVWEGRGSLQFIVSQVKESGVGSLQQQFELLKQKLAAEGLFDAARKRPLPRFPQSVGLITSASGAVIQDMRHRLEQRAPWMRAYLLPVQVQGKGAEQGLARAVEAWGHARGGLPPVDYLIIARGGGSLEDLWCFNEEVLARAIAACPLPVVSAVGHETDFTIADFVADLRAPTPTAAIELTTPDAAALLDWFDEMERTMRQRLRREFETARLRLRAAEHRYLRNPMELLASHAQKVDVLEEELRQAAARRLREEASRLDLLAARLAPRRVLVQLERTHALLESARQRMLSRFASIVEQKRAELDVWQERIASASPQQALKRGFALVRLPSGRLVRRAEQAPPGTQLSIAVSEGELRACVLAEEPATQAAQQAALFSEPGA